MTDGKVKLQLRPRDRSLYRGLREGLDHFGFKVDSLEQTKKELDDLAAADPHTPSGRFLGGNGKKNQEDFQRCCLGRHFIADPDGVLIDVSE
jgi:catechol 2,3-dioxygenase-like lactoylglutathione lyase family enzyme